jgi:hypothetical protein
MDFSDDPYYDGSNLERPINFEGCCHYNQPIHVNVLPMSLEWSLYSKQISDAMHQPTPSVAVKKNKRELACSAIKIQSKIKPVKKIKPIKRIKN